MKNMELFIQENILPALKNYVPECNRKTSQDILMAYRGYRKNNAAVIQNRLAVIATNDRSFFRLNQNKEYY